MRIFNIISTILVCMIVAVPLAMALYYIVRGIVAVILYNLLGIPLENSLRGL